MTARSVRTIAEEIIESTQPPSGVFLELLARSRPATLLCVGLLQQSRRALQAFLVLVDNKLSDATAGHMRVLFENTITGMWLMQDSKANLSRFLADQRKHLEQAVEYMAEYQAMLDQFDSLMDTWVGHHKSASMPSVKDRLTPSTKHGYVIYKDLSGRTHASTMASAMQFAIGDKDELQVARSDPAADEHSLAAMSSLMCVLAMKAYEELGPEATDPLMALHSELMEAWGASGKTNPT